MARKKTDALQGIAMAEAVEAPDFLDTMEAPEFGRKPRLPQPCPVTPLGVQGQKLFFLDSLNQIASMAADLKKGDLKLFFGTDWLLEHFPQHPKGWKQGDPVTKFDQDDAQTALVEDCRMKGIFNPDGRVFGRGAHRARHDEGQLILHMGRSVLLANPRDHKGKQLKPKSLPPGAVGDSYFPALPGLPAPADTASSNTEARELLNFISKWYWVEQEAAPLLLLGFIAQMFICGVLGWRSHVWLAAPTASGKSELQKLIRAVHADWCLFTEDASEAAIRQTLGDDTLPVMIDEAEAHDKPERLAAILNLMKKASSGAKMHRGSADHKAQEFTAQSCFLLSSVLHANMRGEDRNRIAILEMRQVPLDAEELKLDLPHWRQMGRRMHRRMIEQWERFESTLHAYKREIASRRFEGRWRDTYGTLLACADMLLFDDSPRDSLSEDPDEGPDRVRNAVAKIMPMMSRGRVEARSDVDRVLLQLQSHMVPGAHGKASEPLGAWLERAMKLKAEAGQFATDPTTYHVDEEARAKLKAYGLRVVQLERKSTGGWTVTDAKPEVWEGQYLAVAYATNKGLCQVFQGSEWADGIWLQSMGKIPGVEKGLKVRFAGNSDNAIAVPLTALQGGEG